MDFLLGMAAVILAVGCAAALIIRSRKYVPPTTVINNHYKD